MHQYRCTHQLSMFSVNNYNSSACLFADTISILGDVGGHRSCGGVIYRSAPSEMPSLNHSRICSSRDGLCPRDAIPAGSPRLVRAGTDSGGTEQECGRATGRRPEGVLPGFSGVFFKKYGPYPSPVMDRGSSIHALPPVRRFQSQSHRQSR